MKITDSKSVRTQLEKAEAPGKSAAQAPARLEGEPATLSGGFAALGSKLAAEPQFDAARVESIRQAIRDGQLQINAEAIAERLIADVADFLGTRH